MSSASSGHSDAQGGPSLTGIWSLRNDEWQRRGLPEQPHTKETQPELQKHANNLARDENRAWPGGGHCSHSRGEVHAWGLCPSLQNQGRKGKAREGPTKASADTWGKVAGYHWVGRGGVPWSSPKGITGQGESTLLLLGLTQRRGFGPRKEVHKSRLGLHGGPHWPFHQSGWGLRHTGGRGPGTQRKKGKRYLPDLSSDCWADLNVPHY